MASGLMKRCRLRGTHKGSKKKRPKTFRSEQAAKVYAEKMGIKSYELRNLRIDPKVEPKFRIIVKESSPFSRNNPLILKPKLQKPPAGIAPATF